MSATESTHGRERILQRAEELFLQGGYAAVSIRDIARACGISNAAIYHYFAGKEALFLAILDRIGHRYQKILQEAARGDTWLERLTNLSIGMGQGIVEERMTVPALVVSAGQFSSPEKVARMVAKIRQQLVLPFATVLEEGIAAGDVRPMDTALAGWALTGLIFTAGQPFLDPSATPDRIRFALDVFVNGILDKGR